MRSVRRGSTTSEPEPASTTFTSRGGNVDTG
jgi:hypothetical protein